MCECGCSGMGRFWKLDGPMGEKFDLVKMFHSKDFPQDVGDEFADETDNDYIQRIYIDDDDKYHEEIYPLTVAWLLANGAERSDKAVFVWVFD